MRLIDAEALKNSLQNFFNGLVIKNHDKIDEDIYAYIDNAPTISKESIIMPFLMANQRPHGEWVVDINNDDYMVRRGWRCSVCDTRQTYGTPNYCPTCGAQMSEEVQK